MRSISELRIVFIPFLRDLLSKSGPLATSTPLTADALTRLGTNWEHHLYQLSQLTEEEVSKALTELLLKPIQDILKITHPTLFERQGREDVPDDVESIGEGKLEVSSLTPSADPGKSADEGSAVDSKDPTP